MTNWYKSSIGLLFFMMLAACSPTVANQEQEATRVRSNLEVEELAPVQGDAYPLEQVDSVAVTKEATKEVIEATGYPVEEATKPTGLTGYPVEVEMSPTTEPNRSISNENPYVETAVTGLAQQLDVPAEEIQVMLFEAVVWPDSSMGCPQPDMMYTQVLREGYRIVLEHNGKVYNYHGGEGRDPFLCDNNKTRPSTPIPTTDDSDK